MRAVLSLLLLLAVQTFAQSGASPDDTFQPNLKPTLEIRRATGLIEIDGILDDPGWLNAARATNFVEIAPGENVRPPVQTEAFITYDDANLYIAFIADDDPTTIRASLRDRDEIYSDDYVGILFDTFGDASSAYEVFINPFGIQGDVRLTSNGEDFTFDMVFTSEGKITERGYQVEVAIPFSSLRFPDIPVQTWKATFWRVRPRESRQRSSWVPISRDDPCFPCQFGTITGITNVKPSSDLELLPSIIGAQSGALRNPSDASSFENGKVKGEASLGMKYAVSSSITAEATWNPDFSQIESDPGRIDVNTTFALFFPERRPFFLEGRDLFQTWIRTVYTRTINDPLVAAKAVGRMNRTSVVYMGARDEHTPIIIPFEERSAIIGAGKSVTNILRAKQTFLQDSHAGFTVTDMRLDGGGSGSTFSLDGTVRFLDNYRLEAQAVASHTKEPVDSTLTSSLTNITFDKGRTAAFDGESFWGRALYLSVEREARVWDFDIDYWESSPTFRAANGFETRNSIRQTNISTSLTFYDNTWLMDHIATRVFAGRSWNFDGIRKDEWLVPFLDFQFKAQTFVSLSYGMAKERFRGVEFDNIRSWQVFINSRFSEPVQFWLDLNGGRMIARNIPTPALGNGLNVGFNVTIKPFARLVIESGYSFARLDHLNDGPNIFKGYIIRTRLNYQFTRALFLRLVVQYNDFSGAINVEPLLTYRVNPFTVFYIGSTHAYLDPARNGDYALAARQYFMKFQYLFQL